MKNFALNTINLTFLSPENESAEKKIFFFVFLFSMRKEKLNKKFSTRLCRMNDRTQLKYQKIAKSVLKLGQKNVKSNRIEVSFLSASWSEKIY